MAGFKAPLLFFNCPTSRIKATEPDVSKCMSTYFENGNSQQFFHFSAVQDLLGNTSCRYRRIHHVKFLAFHGNQLEYNGSQGANGAGLAGRTKLKGMKSTEDLSITYVLIQSFIMQLSLVVQECFFHGCNKSDHLQLRTATIILQFLHCLGNVTSWNIRLYLKSLSAWYDSFVQ